MTFSSDDWPTAEDYEDWQNLRMSKERQIKFYTHLYFYCIQKRFLFPNVKEEDYEELVQDAVIKHIEKFNKEKGKARAFLLTILYRKIFDFLDSKHQKYAPMHVSQTTTNNSNNEDDDLEDFLEKYPASDLLDFVTLEKNLVRIEHIWRNREKLPAYKWKYSFFIFLEIILSDEETDNLTQIYQIAKNDFGLLTKEKTFYTHVKEGTKQFKRWMLGEDEIPLKKN